MLGGRKTRKPEKEKPQSKARNNNYYLPNHFPKAFLGQSSVLLRRQKKNNNYIQTKTQHVCLRNINMSNSVLVISKFTQRLSIISHLRLSCFLFIDLAPLSWRMSARLFDFPCLLFIFEFFFLLLTEMLLHSKVFLGNLNLDEPSAWYWNYH